MGIYVIIATGIWRWNGRSWRVRRWHHRCSSDLGWRLDYPCRDEWLLDEFWRDGSLDTLRRCCWPNGSSLDSLRHRCWPDGVSDTLQRPLLVSTDLREDVTQTASFSFDSFTAVAQCFWIFFLVDVFVFLPSPKRRFSLLQCRNVEIRVGESGFRLSKGGQLQRWS